MADTNNAKWYVIHTYSGYENKVATDLETIVENRGMQDLILDINIPTEKITEIKDDGSTKEVERKVFPGYVLVKMIVTDESWYVVRNVRGVTGFVGPKGYPLPLTEEEVKRMRLEKPVVVDTDFEIGETVKIVDGTLEGFIGTIDALDIPRGKCKVTVSMFGRPTPVELELYQIERADLVE